MSGAERDNEIEDSSSEDENPAKEGADGHNNGSDRERGGEVAAAARPRVGAVGGVGRSRRRAGRGLRRARTRARLRGTRGSRRRGSRGRGARARIVADGRERRALRGRGRRVRGRRVRLALEECGRAVDAHGLARVTEAVLKDAGGVIGRHVPLAAHHVVDMHAEPGRLGAVLASAEAELGVRHEVGPFVHLRKRAECRRKHETADRVSIAISTMRVQFTTFVSGRNVQVREVTNTSNLHEVRRLDEVCAGDGAVGNQAGAVAILHAPGDFKSLCIANRRRRARLGGREQAEIRHGVDCDSNSETKVPR